MKKFLVLLGLVACSPVPNADKLEQVVCTLKGQPSFESEVIVDGFFRFEESGVKYGARGASSWTLYKMSEGELCTVVAR